MTVRLSGVLGGKATVGAFPVNQGGTGLTSPGTTGNVLTSNGSVWVSSPAAVSLPSQTGNSGKYLTTDGTIASWVTSASKLQVLNRAGTLINVPTISGSLPILTRSGTTVQVSVS